MYEDDDERQYDDEKYDARNDGEYAGASYYDARNDEGWKDDGQYDANDAQKRNDERRLYAVLYEDDGRQGNGYGGNEQDGFFGKR